MDKAIILFLRWLNHYTFPRGIQVAAEYITLDATDTDLSQAMVTKIIVHRFKREIDIAGKLLT